jgi:hypothetical protein
LHKLVKKTEGILGVKVYSGRWKCTIPLIYYGCQALTLFYLNGIRNHSSNLGFIEFLKILVIWPNFAIYDSVGEIVFSKNQSIRTSGSNHRIFNKLDINMLKKVSCLFGKWVSLVGMSQIIKVLHVFWIYLENDWWIEMRWLGLKPCRLLVQKSPNWIYFEHHFEHQFFKNS